MWLCIVIHKNEVRANGPSEQTHMGKKYLLTMAIPDYRPSIENVELSSPVQHNASPDKNSRTTVMVSFLDVTGIKKCPDLSPNQNALRLASGTEPTLIRKEDTTPLTVVQFFLLSAPLSTVASVVNFQQEAAFRTAGELVPFVKASGHSKPRHLSPLCCTELLSNDAC
ncbi:uncharacterized protein TNCV_4010321 [Trichonephila clavipes]|nr:uncharacterized protein TNCV_4010321 [Trichonephila clavipes]